MTLGIDNQSLDERLQQEVGLFRRADVVATAGGVYSPGDDAFLATIFIHSGVLGDGPHVAMEFDYNRTRGHLTFGGSPVTRERLVQLAPSAKHISLGDRIGHIDHAGTGRGPFNSGTWAIRLNYRPDISGQTLMNELVSILGEYGSVLRDQ